MNVILLQDVKDLGMMGDKVTVKDGFARNYLIPRKLAMEATPGAMRVLEQKKKEKQRFEAKLKEESVTLAEKINNTSCTISMEAGEEDRLFGSVTAEMIAESLMAEGIEIDKKKVLIKEPIKSLGVYSIEIDLHPEVKATARIWVIKK